MKSNTLVGTQVWGFLFYQKTAAPGMSRETFFIYVVVFTSTDSCVWSSTLHVLKHGRREKVKLPGMKHCGERQLQWKVSHLTTWFQQLIKRKKRMTEARGKCASSKKPRRQNRRGLGSQEEPDRHQQFPISCLWLTAWGTSGVARPPAGFCLGCMPMSSPRRHATDAKDRPVHSISSIFSHEDSATMGVHW